MATTVLSGGGASSSSAAHPSSTASRPSRRNRLAGLNVAPLPLAGGAGRSIIGPLTTLQRGVQRNRGVQKARDRTIDLRIAGKLAKLGRVDARDARAGHKMNRGNRPVVVHTIHGQRRLGVDRLGGESIVVEHERQ